MTKLKINRKFSVDSSLIEKFVLKNNDVWVYLKSGYPKILICKEGWYLLKLRMNNLGLKPWEFKVEKNEV